MMKHIHTIVFLLIVLLPIGSMAQSLEIVEEFKENKMSTVLTTYKNEFGHREKQHVMDNKFPYAVLEVYLEGDEQAVKAAKSKLSLDLGSHFTVEGVCKTYTNRIVFLISSSVRNVYMTCGDGCKEQVIFSGQTLEQNKIYYGKVKYTPAKVTPTPIPNPKKQIFSFEVNPKNASVEVFVNGTKELCQIDENIQKITLTHGTYRYIVSAPRYQTEEGMISVSDSSRTKTVKLQPNYGWISLTATEANNGASAYATNSKTGERTVLGNIPVAPYELDAGEYQLQILKSKYKNYTKNITIHANDTLIESPILEPNFNHVTLTTDEASEIYVNGELYGKGSWSGTLELGEYTIETRKVNHKSAYTLLIVSDIDDNQKIQLNPPTPIYGSLSVDGNPVRAAIYVDDKHVGESPMIINDLLIGEHQVRVEKDGYTVWKENVPVVESKESAANYKLEKGISLDRIVLQGLNATNLSVKRDGDEVLVFTYDLPKNGPVRLRMSTDGYTYVDQKNVKGDVGKEMDKGKQYQIAWAIPKDLGRTMQDSLYFQVVASPKLPDNGIEIKIGPLFYEDASDPFSVCINNAADVKKITIPTTITYKGYPYRVTKIGFNALSCCFQLLSITIPNSVTSIGSNAFFACHNLTSITIPNGVTKIGEGIFASCAALTSISVDKKNPIYDSRNHCNAIIETKTNTLIAGCKNTVIPKSVTSIGEKAFYWCKNLASITIPNSVTSIGSNAFSWCGNFASITIPNSVTKIGEDVFADCDALTSISVDKKNPIYDSRDNCNAIIETNTNTLIAGCKTTTIPNSITSIGNSAFSGCFNLTSITIPNSVTSIGEGAFYYCDKLTSISIPNSVTSIGNNAFADCDALTSISVDKKNPIYDSRDNCNAIIETNTNTLITGCKTTTIPNSITSIGNSAFSGCVNLTSITIPKSVTSIGEKAFYWCKNLASIIIPNSVTSIGEDAFLGCDNLTSITIPISVTTIGHGAFYSCDKLKKIYIPRGTKAKFAAMDGLKEHVGKLVEK